MTVYECHDRELIEHFNLIHTLFRRPTCATLHASELGLPNPMGQFHAYRVTNIDRHAFDRTHPTLQDRATWGWTLLPGVNPRLWFLREENYHAN